jgi:hypothetical protein
MRRLPVRGGVLVVGSVIVALAFAGAAIAQPTPGGGTTDTGTGGTTDTGAGTTTTGSSENSPTAIRLRTLEQKVQALKERAWRAKARVGILKEDALGGGVGAQAQIVHENKMGSSFRLTKIVYAVDGAQVFARSDDAAESLYKTKTFDVLNGPIAPGSHTISVVAVYRGHGYGVFKYLDKYTFTAKSSHTFTVDEGKSVKVEGIGYEKGGPNTPMEKRADIKFTTTNVAPSAAAASAASPTTTTTTSPGK